MGQIVFGFVSAFFTKLLVNNMINFYVSEEIYMALDHYVGMLPAMHLEGKRGYYPVCNAQEWEQLPDLYKAMEWTPVPDYKDQWKLKAVTAVIFDVVHMEPYQIHAKVAVHPQEVQKILFCLHENPPCHLYSVCGVELFGGTRLSAKWLQDSVTGSFGIYAGDNLCGRQGGFQGFVPACIERQADDTFKYKHYSRGLSGNIVHMEFGNPFPEDRFSIKKPLLEEIIKDAAQVAKGIARDPADRSFSETPAR